MASIIEITNPITGVPEKVDKLDHTAQQIDDAISRALPGGDIDASIQKKPNPNLLDNWHFGNPVDQRQGRIVKPNTTYYSNNTLTTAAGTTSAYVTAYRYTTGTASGVSYASFKLEDTDTAPTYYAAPENVVRGYTGAGYGIDRWKFFEPGATLLIVDGGVRIIRPQSNVAWGTIVENYQLFAGKQVTLSFLTDKGLYSKSFMVPEVKPQGEFYPDYANSGTEIGHICIGIWDSLDGIAVFFNSDGATVSEVTPIAAKLELGSQQTLAHQDADGNWVLNELPNYADTLARCQRQAEKSCNMETSVGSPETASPIIKKADSKWGFYDPMVFFKVPKRTIPAVKIFSAKTGAEGMAYDETTMQDVAVTSSYVGQNSFTVQHASENLVTGHAYQFYYFATAEL